MLRVSTLLQKQLTHELPRDFGGFREPFWMALLASKCIAKSYLYLWYTWILGDLFLNFYNYISSQCIDCTALNWYCYFHTRNYLDCPHHHNFKKWYYKEIYLCLKYILHNQSWLAWTQYRCTKSPLITRCQIYNGYNIDRHIFAEHQFKHTCFFPPINLGRPESWLVTCSAPSSSSNQC